MFIRDARPQELPNLSDLCLRSKAVWGYDRAFIEACREELTFRREELDTTYLAVADGDSGVAGVVQVRVNDGQAELLKLFVEPAKIKSGIGRQLFNWAVAKAKLSGAGRLIIESDPDAAAFYRRMGAYDDGCVPSGSIPGRMLPKLSYDLRQGGASQAT